MEGRVQVAIYADDPLTRTGLATELRRRPDIELVEPTAGGSARVVVLALDALTASSLELIRMMRSREGTQVVLVISSLSDDELLAVVESGACSVLWRWEATTTWLSRAVVRAATGEAALPSDLLTRLLKRVGRIQHDVLRPQGLSLGGLSDRERRVLRLAADGFDTDEIAGELAYSKRTVTSVVHDITVRYQLRNRTHAVAYAIREGLI
ncbi:response regulator transcription factor [Kitasatospora sp. NPDC048540]|uniref:response regulator transcription factor n=1 Tax=unclassified Kitasatospora TaxID=2633591 RepID=UPI000539EC77|nr:response regulator transcription factor [Kitasatospora sp. MBT63]